ncbi:MAG: AraC family transcriptional regulator [Sphingomonas sp.]
MTAAHGVVDFVRGFGVEVTGLLESVGLSPAVLDNPANRIELSRFCSLFESAADRCGRPDIGLAFGARYRPENLGFLGYLAANAPTLGRALEDFARYLPLHQQGTFMDLEPCFGDRVGVSYSIIDRSVTERRQDAELSLAVILNLLRSALGRDWTPDEVHFAHAKPGEGARRHESVFGAPIYFQQNCNRIILSRALLDQPMPRHDPLLRELILAEFRRLAPTADYRIDIVSAAQHHIERQLPEGQCSLETVAAACDLTPWTLKRRLHDADTTFQQLLARTRHRLASRYLVDYEMSVTETALALGYSEVSAFSRAFRQWTGISARRFAGGRGRGQDPEGA